MTTFEERYTAWIDGQLQGPSLSAFEQELARRAAEGEAAADKADTVRLRELLQDYFQAPPLTNPDFFSHQLRERIDAERTASSRGREPSRREEPAFFAWGFARLVGLCALSLFAAAAIYYGMMPPHGGPATDLAVNHGAAGSEHNTAANPAQVAVISSPAPIPSTEAPTQSRDADGNIRMVQNMAPTPVPIDLSTDIRTQMPDPSNQPTTVTPLHYNSPSVNVLWRNGLEYLPSVSEAGAAANVADTSASAPSPVPAPSASASP